MRGRPARRRPSERYRPGAIWTPAAALRGHDAWRSRAGRRRRGQSRRVPSTRRSVPGADRRRVMARGGFLCGGSDVRAGRRGWSHRGTRTGWRSRRGSQQTGTRRLRGPAPALDRRLSNLSAPRDREERGPVFARRSAVWIPPHAAPIVASGGARCPRRCERVEKSARQAPPHRAGRSRA